MGSTRLPGKVLKDIEGVTMLGRVVQRLSRASLIDGLVIATTDLPADDAIVQECQGSSIKVFRGAELDVLDRYFRAAQVAKAEVVVRITSDCPLIDPEVTDKTIAAFLNEMPAYASNCVVRTFPRGLDTEVMTVLALERAWRGADQTYQRIHVTPFIYEHPSEFRILSVTGDADFSHHRWTVDTPEDLEFVRTIYSRLKSREDFRWLDVLEVLDREPGLMELNRSVAQKAVHEG